MRDTRKDLVTITMTNEEWDSLGIGVYDRDAKDPYVDSRARLYAEDLRWRVQEKIAQATPGAVERRACALARVEAKIPVLDRSKKHRIGNQVRYLLAQHDEGTLAVDHLGEGPDTPENVGGYRVTLIPHTFGGSPALSFRMSPEIWFEREQKSLKEEDKNWFVKLVNKYRDVTDFWSGGPWLSVRFQ